MGFYRVGGRKEGGWGGGRMNLTFPTSSQRGCCEEIGVLVMVSANKP